MKGIVETVAGVIERLSLSSTEKKRLKQELETLLVDYEREHLQVQSGVLRNEAQGNWLQRSWRPVIMLAFAVVILVGMFTDLPMLEDTSRFGICWKSDWVVTLLDVFGRGSSRSYKLIK